MVVSPIRESDNMKCDKCGGLVVSENNGMDVYLCRCVSCGKHVYLTDKQIEQIKLQQKTRSS